MNISNNKCINRLSLRSIKTNRQQVLMTVLAIMLTTTLFTALFSIFLGIKTSIDDFTCRSYGSCADARIEFIDDKAGQILKDTDLISKAGFSKGIGIYTNEQLFRIPAAVMYSDPQASKFRFTEPSEGHEAKEADEIVLDTYIMGLLGVEKKIGAPVKLSFTVSTPSQDTVSGDFKLAGYYEVSGNCPQHMINVSEKYADSIADQYALKNFKSADISYRSLLNPAEKNAEFAVVLKNAGSASMPVFNEAVTPDLTEDIELIVCCAVICLIIFLTGFLIINNIFRIKLASEIRYYGLLKTIGVTSRQLKKIIRLETTLLCLIGIPLGLLTGYLSSRVVLPYIMRKTTDETVVASQPYLPVIFVFSALFALVTVRISNSASVSKTSKVSPVEALRYNEAASVKKAHKTDAKGVTALVRKNISANKLKTAMVILSFALAISLFTGVSFLGNGIKEDTSKGKDDMEFVIGTRDFFLGEPDGFPLTAEQIDTFRKDLGGDLKGSLYECDNALLEINGKTLYDDSCAQILGYDQDLLKLIKNSGKLTDEESDGVFPAVIEKNEVFKYKVGDVVELQHKRVKATDKTTGEEVDINTVTSIDDYNLDAEITSYKVRIVAETDSIPVDIAPQYTFWDCARFILTSDALKAITDGKYHVSNYCIDTKDAGDVDRIENYLDKLTNGNTSTLRYMSRATELKESQNLNKAFSMTGYFLCFIVGAIAVINFVNAVMTEAVTRKREFALLRAVGMTNSQLRGMLMKECGLYTAGAFILALPCEILLMMLIKAADFPWIVITPASLVLPYLILLPVFALLCIAVPALIYEKNKSKSIMEEFRESY